MLKGSYEEYIHKSRYARWLPGEQRRETWYETVSRYIDFFKDKHESTMTSKEWLDLRGSIYNCDVMPSMRALMTAGPALDRDNVAGYNCAYTAIDNVKAFDEIMYILMCGTGVGFSVERDAINKLDGVPEVKRNVEDVIVVRDSKTGWAEAYRKLLRHLYEGEIPRWDLSRIRPAGSPLKTFGGRASGPQPLEDLFNFTCSTFSKVEDRKLNSLEVHDIVCKIADIVVVGGVRRSALISLSNLTDSRMAHAKSGDWYREGSGTEHRQLANNSVVYTEKPDVSIFMKEWRNLYDSHSGERGIVNRQCFQRKCEFINRNPVHEFGTNPCGEIILRSGQLCNLSEVIIRREDTLEDLRSKVGYATTLGTLQATLTDFRYLSAKWKRNCEEERLLGVSLTGLKDHEVVSRVSNDTKYWLNDLHHEAVLTNETDSDKLGINRAAAITCVKPSGTVSQLVDSSSGMHDRYSKYYIRRVKGDLKDPLTKMMLDQEVPFEISVSNPETEVQFCFPRKSPTTVYSTTGMAQLEYWKMVNDFWCDHNPSTTIYYNDKSFLEMGAWVYKNFDSIGGLSFFESSNTVYSQLPYESITSGEYQKRIAKVPDIDWSKLSDYENEDTVNIVKELSCHAGVCEI